MTAYGWNADYYDGYGAGAYVGQDTGWRAFATQTVQNTARQQRSLLYGYLGSRSPDPTTGQQTIRQKVYLFPSLEQARAWFDQHIYTEAPHDYAAVFAQTDLSAPIAGMEHDAHAHGSSDTAVGQWALALGIPAGALAGYYYGKWRERNPDKWIPWVSGDASVGELPWQSIVGCDPGFVQRPWYSIVGQDAQRPHARALIQQATDDATFAATHIPANYYVWRLEAPARGPYAGQSGAVIELEPTSFIESFDTRDEALVRLRELGQQNMIARAMFDRTSAHWPNPVTWQRSDAPEHQEMIATFVSSRTMPPGIAVGELPWYDIVGQTVDERQAAREALSCLRSQATAAASDMPGAAVAAVRNALGEWVIKSFRSLDDADSWWGQSTVEPRNFSYAIYFSKSRDGTPTFENDKIGTAVAPLCGDNDPTLSSRWRRSATSARAPGEIASMTVTV